jgi:hypothetical protein
VVAYLAHEVEAEVVLDVPAEPLGEVADDAALVDAARGRPPLPLVLPHPLPEAPGQVLPLHPQLHAPQPRVHRLLLGRRRVQKHLPPIARPYDRRRRSDHQPRRRRGSVISPDVNKILCYYLDVADEHGHEDQPTGDGDDVEHDLQPLRRALQVPERAEQRQQQQ